MSAPSGPEAEGKDTQLEKTTPYADNAVARKLDNGMTVTMERLPYLHSASAGVWIRTGSVNETKKNAGISHFIEHLFFKGTQTRTARQLVEAIESRGGHINAFTSREYTCVYVRTLDTHIANGIEILADIIKNSTFCDLEKERNVVLEEIASIEDVPEDHIHDLLAQRLWPNHALGRPVTGYHETISNVTLEDTQGYYRKWYRPRNMYFSIAGNFDDGAVLDQVCSEFGCLRPSGPIKLAGPPKPETGIEVVQRDIAQNHFCLGFPGPAVSDPRRYAYDVLGNALGGSSTSRLFNRIREEEALAYAIYSFHSSFRSTGIFGVYAAVAPEKFQRTLALSCEEIRKFRDDGISEEELHNSREHLKGNLLMALENTFNRMSRMAKSMMFYRRVVGLGEIIDAVDGVSTDDVRELALDIFRPEKCASVVLGPAKGDAVQEIPL